MSGNSLRFSLLPSVRALEAQPQEMDLTAFYGLLRDHGQRYRGKDGAVLVGAALASGDGRTKGTKGKVGRFNQTHLVEDVSIWALDIDEDPDKPELRHDWRLVVEALEGVGCLVYSSASHGRADYPEHKRYRFRVVGAYARPVTAEEHGAIMRELHRHLCELGFKVDESCKDPTRKYFTPRQPEPDALLEPFLEEVAGKALDPDALPGGRSVAALLEAKAAKLAKKKPAAKVRHDWQNLKGAARRSADKYIEKALVGVLDDIATGALRRPAFYGGAKRLGMFLAADAIDRGQVEQMKADALAIMRSRMGHEYDEADLVRQWENGISDGIDIGPADLPTRSSFATTRTSTPKETAKPRKVYSVEEGAAVLEDEVRVSLTRPRDVTLRTDPGVGKTRATLRETVRQTKAALGQGTPLEELERYVYVGRTHQGLDEVRETLEDIIDEEVRGEHAAQLKTMIFREPSRREEGMCDRRSAIDAAHRVSLEAVNIACKRCPLHPRQNDGRAMCGFWQRRRSAKDAFITLTTHELAAIKSTERRIEIDLEDIEAKRSTGRTFVPVAYVVGDDRLRLTVEAGKGAPLPALDLEDVREKKLNMRVWFFENSDAADEHDEALLAAYLPGARGRAKAVIVDENPKAALLSAVSLDLEDVKEWWASGDLPGETAEGLRQVLSADRLGSRELGEMLPEVRVTKDEHTGQVLNALARDLERRLEDADDDDDGKILAEMKAAPDYRALGALEAAARAGWAGCYVADGVLHLTPHRRFRFDADSVVYLDGTADPDTARAMFGEMDFVDIPVKLRSGTTVERVDLSASKSRFHDGKPDSETLERQMRAIVSKYEGQGTAWCVHKSMLPGWYVEKVTGEQPEGAPSETWAEDELGQALADERVTWFGSAASVGSNRFEGCERIVVLTFFAPRAAFNAEAEKYEGLARAHGLDIEADFYAAAQEQIETAPVVQTVHRVRPVRQEREIVIVDCRDLPGFEADRVLDPDELVAEELGLAGRGAAGVVPLLREMVALHGAVPLNRRGFRRLVTCGPPKSPKDIYRGDLRTACHTEGDAAEALLARVYRYFGRDPGAMADAAGLGLAFLRTSRGGDPLAVLFDESAPPSAAALADALREEQGLEWVEWRGQRVTLDDVAQRAIDAALSRISTADEVTVPRVAEVAGVSRRHAYRLLKSAHIEGTEGLRERWLRLHAPKPIVIADPSSPAEVAVLIFGRGRAWWAAATDEQKRAAREWARARRPRCDTRGLLHNSPTGLGARV